jgi:hypothetical protein
MPVTIVTGIPGRHLFEGSRDPRVRLVSALDEAREPDLIVFPCAQDRRFEKISQVALPAQVTQRIADGRTGLVFDASTEGVPQKPDVVGALHSVIAKFNASPAQCVYVTQERNYEADYRLHCAAHGLATPVTVLVHDYWIWEAVRHYEQNGDSVYRGRLEEFRARPRRRARRFISLNRTPRPAKIVFLLTLLRDGLWDLGFVSFGGFRQGPEGPGKTRPSEADLMRALPGFEDLVADVSPGLDRLDGYGRVLLGMEQHGWKRLELWNAGMAAELGEYGESWFSVVTETEMRHRPSRITEKILKPLVNFHPLIVLGNPGSLAMIREYGFRTFGGVIDESYDEELDPRRRFDRAYSEIARLCRLDDAAWSRLEASVADTLMFNAHWGLTQLPTARRRERDIAVLDGILRAVGVAGTRAAAPASQPPASG